MNYQTCNDCSLSLPLDADNFHRQEASPTGFRKICKLCRNNKLQCERSQATKLRGKVTMTISDTQAPYQHPDTIPFIKAVKKKYDPDETVHIGDETDNYFLSSFLKDPYSDSPVKEVEDAKQFLQELAEVCPDMQILKSNHVHGRLVRAARVARIPMQWIKDLKEIYEVDANWTWHDELVIDNVLFRHGDKDAKSAARIKYYVEHHPELVGLVMGHHHTELGSVDVNIGNTVVWRAYVGSLIWRHAEAFSYATSRPMIGMGMVINQRFHPLPMKLDKHERWTGEL